MPLATPRLHGAPGQLSLALGWGPPALIGTGGAAHSWVASHSGLAAQLEGPRGTLSAALPRACPGLFTQVALLLCPHGGGGGSVGTPTYIPQK